MDSVAKATADGLELLPPSLALLSQYAAALERGWSPNNLRDVSATPSVLLAVLASSQNIS